MAKFVLAGRADCPSFARAEMLADRLTATLPDFRVHKIVQPPEEWPSWLQEQCSLRGWSHASSPLVWRELVDRGGRGAYLGGLREFQHYASHHYDITPSTDEGVERKIAEENVDTLKATQLERNTTPKATPKATPLRVCITNASSETAYHLASLVATGGVFEGDRPISLRLLTSADCLEQLGGTAMELSDLASPSLAGVSCSSSAQEAFSSASVVFILDYPYKGTGEVPESSREDVATASKEEIGDESVNVEGKSPLGSEAQEGEETRDEGPASDSEGKVKVFGDGDANRKDQTIPSEPVAQQTEAGSEQQGGEEGSEGRKPQQEGDEASGGAATETGDGSTGTEGALEASGSQPHTNSNQIPTQLEEKRKESGTTSSENDPSLLDAARLYHRYASLLDYCAQKDVKVVVSGRFANTGASIMARTVTSLPPGSFVASSSQAEQQAKALLAKKLGLNGSDVSQVAVWGRTCGRVLADVSHTQVQHFRGAIIGPDRFSLPLSQCIFDREWVGQEFPSLLAARHGGLEGYRGRGTPLAEAVGLARMVNQWCGVQGDNSSGWSPVGVVSRGEYGVPEGLVFSLPARCVEGEWQVEAGLALTETLQTGIAEQVTSLQRELTVAMETIKLQEP